jgi:polar amino acid transport system substrate-binding protein
MRRFQVGSRCGLLVGLVLGGGVALAPFANGSVVRASAPGASKSLHNLLPAKIKQAGAIKVASDLNYPPLDYFKPDGTTPTGADYEIAQALGKKLGVKMKFTNVTFDNIIPSLLSGQYDLASTFMTDTAAREKTVDFVDEYKDGTSILVKKGNPEHIQKLLDLCGKTATTTKTSVQIPLANAQTSKCQAQGKGPINLLLVGTDTEAQLQVKSGRATADLADSVTAAYDAKQSGGGKDFQVVPGVYQKQPVGITVPKNDPKLRTAMVQALKAVMAAGTYKKILHKYGLDNIAVKKVTVNLAGKSAS